jgi:hypothetical protein
MRITFRPRFPRFTIQRSLARALAFSVLCVVSGVARAAAIYDPGPLKFSTVNQSIWGPGSAAVFTDSEFLGPQWTNRTVGVGGFTGSLSTVTINTNPAWWAWKACKETIDFLCGGEPSKGQIQEVIDTRTGARVDLTTSGKFGLEWGYTVNSGSVNAAAAFSASAALPGANTKHGEFFSLNPDSKLEGGSILSQSPQVEAHINAIAQLSASVTAQACLILTGCTGKGTHTFPSLNMTQPVLSIDPNSIKVLGDLLPPDNPGEPRKPLAEVKLANQTLTVQAAVDVTGVPGWKLTTSQFTLVDTTPPTPDVTIDLASIEFKLPNIATSGGLGTRVENGIVTQVVESSGRDDIIKLRLDVDALASGLGLPVQGGAGLTLIDEGGIKIGAQFDLWDVDIGPDIGVTQDFELEPTLMVRLDFSKPVMIAGQSGLQTFWEGEWDLLPEIALLETTTFSPTFWLDATLTHIIGIDLGLTGTMDILKFSFSAEAGPVKILETNPISLNSLLGLGNQLFSTSKLEVPIWGKDDDDPFTLGGFEQIKTASFTITIAAVPTPGTLVLLLAALGAAALSPWRPRLKRGVKAPD